MSNKPIKLPDIGFNEALQRIARFHKDDLLSDKEKDSSVIKNKTNKSPSNAQESNVFTDRYKKTKGND